MTFMLKFMICANTLKLSWEKFLHSSASSWSWPIFLWDIIEFNLFFLVNWKFSLCQCKNCSGSLDFVIFSRETYNYDEYLSDFFLMWTDKQGMCYIFFLFPCDKHQRHMQNFRTWRPRVNKNRFWQKYFHMRDIHAVLFNRDNLSTGTSCCISS